MEKIKFYSANTIENAPFANKIPSELLRNLKIVAQMLPFRVNQYVAEDLVNWADVPNDPIFQLCFLQKEMVSAEDFSALEKIYQAENLTSSDKAAAIYELRMKLNPHPAGQNTANVPTMDEETVPGVQHKYRETALVFPKAGQTCHSYCTFCFRWPQFVGLNDLKFATDQAKTFVHYLKQQKQITDVIFTGGDPMVMNSKIFSQFIDPLLEPGLAHIQNIRIGSKSLGYWPRKFIDEDDSEKMLDIFRKVTNSGKHLAFMAHFSHHRELETELCQQAVKKIQSTGAVIRSQSPVLRHINDDSNVWLKMWQMQLQQGIVPYYMFVERDTGPKEYFSIPLVKAYELYTSAVRRISGLGRTVRGPSMSAFPGKVCVEGVDTIHGEKVIILKFLQARNAEHCYKPFFAKYDPEATWLDQLQPAFSQSKFFWE